MATSAGPSPPVVGVPLRIASPGTTPACFCSSAPHWLARYTDETSETISNDRGPDLRKQVSIGAHDTILNGTPCCDERYAARWLMGALC